MNGGLCGYVIGAAQNVVRSRRHCLDGVGASAHVPKMPLSISRHRDNMLQRDTSGSGRSSRRAREVSVKPTRRECRGRVLVLLYESGRRVKQCNFRFPSYRCPYTSVPICSHSPIICVERNHTLPEGDRMLLRCSCSLRCSEACHTESTSRKRCVQVAIGRHRESLSPLRIDDGCAGVRIKLANRLCGVAWMAGRQVGGEQDVAVGSYSELRGITRSDWKLILGELAGCRREGSEGE